VRWLWPAAVLLLAALPLFPSLFGSYAVTLFTLIFFYGFLGQAWNIVGGFAGQLSAGHAAFLGIGAYTAALLSVEKGITPWVGMFVGGALAAALGTLVGFLGFRFGLRGFYFVLLTVAFAEICRIIASNTDAIGGAVGYYITFTGDPRQFQFQDARVYYYVALALMLAATGVVAWLARRRFGVYLSAIREDESACEALGVDTFRYKMLAMMLSSFLTGVGEADRALERKAEVVSNLSRVVEKDSVMFVERARVRMSIRGVPVIAREELRRAKDRDDVEEMISERKG